jgi:tetratricopeptide (TPR) repeat protein
VLAQFGDDARALADYSKAIELNPDYIDAILARSRLYLRRKDPEAALVDIGRSIEFAPEVSILYAYRGAAKAIGGDRAGGLADFDRAGTVATDSDEINAINELRHEFGL